MQMGPKEIAVEYRTAVNKQKQIKVLAELNQCAERKIAEILAEEGEELPKKWQEQLQKPERRSRKFPEGEATPDDDAPAPVSPAEPATDRDLFDAVASLLPEAAARVSPKNAEEARAWVDGVGPAPIEPEETAESPRSDEGIAPYADGGAEGITAEDLLLGACKNLLAALDLKPDEFHCYACGTLDLVFSLIGVPMVWQPIHRKED